MATSMDVNLSLILLCLVAFGQLDFVASKPIRITSNNCNGTDSVVPALHEIIELLGERTNQKELVSLIGNIVTMLSSMMQIQQDNHQQLINVVKQFHLEGQERPRPNSIPDLQTSVGPELLGELQKSPEPEVQISQEPEVHTSQAPELHTSQEPELYTSQEPELYTSQETELHTSQEPELSTSQEPELHTSQEPELYTSQEPELHTSQEPELETSQETELETSQEPELETSQETGPMQDCSIAQSTGQYSISPENDGSNQVNPFMVVCDIDTTSGGWIVIQRRFNGSVSFDRNWADYENGFGSLDGEFWLGLGKMHLLTSRGSWKLRFDLEDFEGSRAYAEYDYFQVGNSTSFYQLTIRSYSGTAGDAMSGYKTYDINGMAFTTNDQDHDERSTASDPNCGIKYRSGWWHKNCAYSNVNGLYLGQFGYGYEGMTWYHMTEQWNALKKTEMKIKRVE